MLPLDHIAALRAANPLEKQGIIDTFADEHLNERWLEAEWMGLLDSIGGPDEAQALAKLEAQYTRLKFLENSENSR